MSFSEFVIEHLRREYNNHKGTKKVKQSEKCAARPQKKNWNNYNNNNRGREENRKSLVRNYN